MKKIIVLCFILSVLLFNCKKEKIPYPAYSIGTIIYWDNSARGPSQLKFSYYAGGQQNSILYLNGDNGWTVPTKGSYNTGDKYMVQYDQENLKKARMLFDFPVKDSLDYTNDVNQFNTHPPSCCLIPVYNLTIPFHLINNPTHYFMKQ